MKWLKTDLYRALVLTILAGLAAVTVALANRDIYSKDEIDAKLDAAKENRRGIERQIDHIQSDVEWLVRNQGGTPSAETDEDRHSP
jgi:peptidoglycan hydrolase CwlO-like protein